jgi:hypothetical protein
MVVEFRTMQRNGLVNTDQKYTEFLVEKNGSKTRGRRDNGWDDNTKMDLKCMEFKDVHRIILPRSQFQWWDAVNRVMSFWSP